MENIYVVRKKYYEYMMTVIEYNRRNYSEENHSIANAAIRRYYASLKLDYKTLWEESEWLLSNATARLYQLEHQVKTLELFHGVKK
jgi:hypothetical protein